jgi:hypothetical protein
MAHIFDETAALGKSFAAASRNHPLRGPVPMTQARSPC